MSHHDKKVEQDCNFGQWSESQQNFMLTSLTKSKYNPVSNDQECQDWQWENKNTGHHFPGQMARITTGIMYLIPTNSLVQKTLKQAIMLQDF